VVWVIWQISPRSPWIELHQNGDPRGAVQGRNATQEPDRLVMLRFPCDRIDCVRDRTEPQITRDEEAPMIDQQIDIPTKDGKTTTFITHPERGGPFPVIIFYMDAPAIREELRDMARRLGTSGYYVMLPNLYYRADVMEIGPVNPDPESPERKRMFQLMNSINIPLVMQDTKALLAYAEGQAAANTGIVGTVGYCMSGRYAVNAATHFPDRVKAAASVYGTHLATDQPDSPHLAPSKTKAELYFACAEEDIHAPMEIIEKVKAGMKGTNNEVEIYPGTHHGFAFPKRPVYHRDAAERHWERLLALYRRNLG
jgi:carboxymethylenebutenolidase